jgi:Ser/Thr protein kinase RdoA (MazF antagonist)
MGFRRSEAGQCLSVAVLPNDPLIRAARERYALGHVTSVQRLRGGYANDVFLLTAVEQRLVLRVKYPPVDLDSLTWEHRLLNALSNTMREVPAPLRTRDGATFFLFDGRPVSLMPYLPGAPARPEDRVPVAQTLGRVHATTVRLPQRPGHPRLRDLPFPEIGALPSWLENWRLRIRQARSDAIDLVDRLAKSRPLRNGIAHNDIFPGNVLMHEGRASALLDWEEADIDWLVWDLACGLWTFCNHRDEELDSQAAGTFLAAYREAGGTVPPNEDDLIVPLVRVKRILEVLRAPTDRDPRWDYQLANLRAYENLR